MRHRTPTAAHPAVAGLGTVLGVWAHPDDEAYLSAGLMAHAVRAGHEVVVVTVTAGERGTDDPARWPPRRLARRRRRELAAALAAVGVRDHHVLGVGDGRCPDVPLDEGAALVGRWLARVRPATVVAFGPDGFTGHPDHRAVAAWVRRAWERDGRRARLLHPAATEAFHARWGELNARTGLWYGAPPSTPERDLAVGVDLAGEVLDAKVAALRAHASQTAALEAAVGAATYRAWRSQERFVDAAVAEPLPDAGALVPAGARP